MSLLLVALVSVAVQGSVSVARETASGINFARPAGWLRQELENQSVAFVPPGPDGDRYSAIILPVQASLETHAVAHRDVFQLMTSESHVVGRVRQDIANGWLHSQARVMTAQGQTLWISLYSVQTNGRLAAVMAIAVSEQVYQFYRPTVEQVIAGATLDDTAHVVAAPAVTTQANAAAGTAIHGLFIPYPSDWVRREDQSGSVMLIPPQLRDTQLYFLSVLPPRTRNATHWETHKAILAEVLAEVQWTDEPVTIDYPDGPGPFIRTGIAGHVVTGTTQQIELYTAAHGDTIETVVGVNGIDRNVTDPVLSRVTFVDPRGSGERPRIAEAYRRINQRAYVNQQGGSPIAGSVLYDRIWLRADGVADFSTTYPEGYAASMLPFKVDVSLLNGDFGSWRNVGNQVHITRRAGMAPVVYVRENGGLREGSSWWEPMPRIDDLKLSGRWSIRSPPNETVSPYYDWIDFTSDGRFSTSGVLKRVSFGMVDRPKPPDPASGTYRLQDWTIFFTFTDGSTWSKDFSILGRDVGDVTAILFGTDVYPRER